MMTAPGMTDKGTKLCLFCCYSFTPPKGSRMLHFVEYRNRQLRKFFEGFLSPLGSPGQRSSKSSSVVRVSVDERECLQLGGGGGLGGNMSLSFEGLSICNDCLSMILIITEGKGRVDRVEEQLRLLQRQGVQEMNRLSKEMGRLEELMEGGDAASLAVEEEDQVGSSSSRNGSRRELATLRESILKAAKNLQTYNSNLSRKLKGDGVLCGCGARIGPPSYQSERAPSRSVITPNLTFDGDPDLEADPAELADQDQEIEDVEGDVKVFGEGYQNRSPLHSPSPSSREFGSSEDDSQDGGELPKAGTGSTNIPVQQSKPPGRPAGERSHLVLKLLKKARRHHHRGYQYQSLGECQGQEARGRPRDPIRDEFDRTDSGRAKCRRCGRSLNYRVDIMKSHKSACLRRSMSMEARSALQDPDDVHPGSRCRSRGDPEGQPEPELNEPAFKMSKPQGPVTVTEPAKFSGRPRDSIRNEFDMTESGKAKCRICGRCIGYRVDTMKSHKRACIRAMTNTPKDSDGIRDSLYPEGRPELELNETTGKMRKPRYRRRTPGTEPSSTGRPRDSIRDEFELTPEGKVKCKDCNHPITNRVDIMKSHKLRCSANEATYDTCPGGASKSKRKPALELDEKTGEMKRRKKLAPKHDTPGRPRDFIWREFDQTERGKARCRDCGRAVAYRVDLMKKHKLRCSQISTNESHNSQKLI